MTISNGYPIPTGPKPAWAVNLQESKDLVDAHRRANGVQSVPLGSEVMFNVNGRGYAAFASGPNTYTILGQGGMTTCVTSASAGQEPDEDASDAEWDAYMNVPKELEAAVLAAGI